LLLVHIAHGPSQLLDHFCRAERRQGPSFESACQTTALDKFHREEGQTVVLAKIINVNDARVIQASHGLGFALKSNQRLVRRVLQVARRLKGDDNSQTKVNSLIDNAHASRIEPGHDLVSWYRRKLGKSQSHGRNVYLFWSVWLRFVVKVSIRLRRRAFL